MDINGDEKLDIVCGGFEGFVYYMKADGKGQYSSPKRLKDSAGKDINLGEFYNHQKQEYEENKDFPVRDLGIYPIVSDWDDDGDLDIIIGGFRGKIGVRINEGSKSTMKFSPKILIVNIPDDIFKETGTSVKYIDWNGDGKKDLICGLNYKGIVFVKNIGTSVKPVFGKAKYLVRGKLDYDWPSSYVTVDVADINGDSKLDLLASAQHGKYGQEQSKTWIYFRK